MGQIDRLRLFAAFACFGIFVAGVSVAGLIPGPGRSGCYAEFDVAGATTNSNHVTCEDGDPACDTDGQCQGTCTFSIQLCVNQTNVSGCTPSPFKKPPRVKGDLLPVPATQGADAACGNAAPITVPLIERGRKKLPGRRKLELRANTSGSPPREKAFLFLTCTPRKGACPLPTTTTTVVPTTTTTTL